MKQELDAKIRPVIVASRDQILTWSNDGGIPAGRHGAGYAHQKLTHGRIVCFSAPVSVLENYDFDSTEPSFPVLVELKDQKICELNYVSFEDVQALHFRSTEEQEMYERYPTVSFGLTDVPKLTSPELFDGDPNLEPISSSIVEFDANKHQKLEILAGALLFAISARRTNEVGTAFVNALAANSAIDLPPLLEVIVDYRWGRPCPSSTIGLFVYRVLDFMMENLEEYRAINSEEQAVKWSLKLLETTRDLDEQALSEKTPPSARFEGMANILTSKSPLADLPDPSNPFRVMQYAILIALMRRDSKSFMHWVSNGVTNCEEVQLVTAFLLGFRCDRRSILERKVRTSEVDKALTRAISKSMSLTEISTLIDLDLFKIEPLPEKKIERKQNKRTPIDSISTTHQTLRLAGQGLVGFNVEQRPSGDFVVTITASAFVDQVAQSTNGEVSIPGGSEVDVARKGTEEPNPKKSVRPPRENSGDSPSRKSRARIGSKAEVDAPLLNQEATDEN